MTDHSPFADKRGKSLKIQGVGDLLAVIVATGGGAGFIPVAPGTWGSLVGLLIAWGGFAVVRRDFDAQVLLVFLSLLLAAIGIWVGTRAEKIFHQKDASQVVIDEVCGQVISFTLVAQVLSELRHSGTHWHWWLGAGFLLFRAFDIFKPYPINQLQDLPGGLGVMMDDVLAGIYAAVVLSLGTYLFFWVSGS